MTDERGTSTVVNYVLGLTIAFALVTGLFIAGEQFVSDQREEAIRTELEVLGEQVSADLMRADRLARTTEHNEVVRVSRTLPEQVAGSQYGIELAGGEDPVVRLRAGDPEVTVESAVANETHVEMGTLDDHHVVVNYTASGTLALESGGEQ